MKKRVPEKLSSELLAALIVDALHRAGMIKEVDIQRSIVIANEEIDARKGIGDY